MEVTTVFCVLPIMVWLVTSTMLKVGVPRVRSLARSKWQDVTLEDGTAIIAADYISPRSGKIITIFGDTRKTDASVRLGQGDVLVHESNMARAMRRLLRNNTDHHAAAEAARSCSASLNHISASLIKKTSIAQGCVQHFEKCLCRQRFEEVEIWMRTISTGASGA